MLIEGMLIEGFDCSAGCIAALDQLNPRVYSVLGSEPWVGVRLKVKWLRLTGTYQTFNYLHVSWLPKML